MTQADNGRVSRVFGADETTSRTVEGTTIGVEQFISNFGEGNQLAALSIASHGCGDMGPEHFHPHLVEYFICAGGEGDVYINGAPHRMGKGDVAIVHAGDRHYLRGVSTLTPFEVYCILVPPTVCACTTMHEHGEVSEGEWTVKV